MEAQVLVVEDDPDIREAVVGLLQAETPWLRVASASDGMEALELLEEGAEPRLALLDVMMPVMNGIEFLDALRERHLAPEIAVVLISAHVRIPFRPEDLLAIVRRHCPTAGSEATEH